MRLGIKCDYQISQEYSSFLCKENIRQLQGDNISNLIAEFVISRFTYSLGS